MIGPDNAQVGDVNDVLFDKSGKIVGVIVGVGGFLGIGEKKVAIDMSALEPVSADIGSSAAGGNSAVSSSNDPTNVKSRSAGPRISSRVHRTSSTTKRPSRTTEPAGRSPTPAWRTAGDPRSGAKRRRAKS